MFASFPLLLLLLFSSCYWVLASLLLATVPVFLLTSLPMLASLLMLTSLLFLIQVQTGKECGHASTLPFTEDIPLKRLCRKFLAVLPGWDLLSVAALPSVCPQRPRSDGLKLLPSVGCPGNGLPTGRPGTTGKLRSELVPGEDCSASPSKMSRALFPRNDMRKSSSCTYAQAKEKIFTLSVAKSWLLVNFVTDSRHVVGTRCCNVGT